MSKYAQENFSTMTDLADLLVQQAGLDFRDAHELIADVVNRALAQKKTANQIIVNMIQDAARKRLGHTLPILNKQLQVALDPAQSVERKTGIGMPATSSVKQMLASSQADIADKTNWLKKQEEHLKLTYTLLTQTINNYK
ncbi:hypothetical protein HH214_06045 [Mucilaginibacter robiniae]|uniref:Argininosuccinate lyase C-terminal domain-containing protein n=1 Tax=Mucilaginibacter robiniae TaxID=2728022 RepID=A0A7L5DWL2_9SPHI|nr:hypothetical protein [Mucilaginibacter robiniae]QJD95465.1 hypothetical protein HH214_06045 [Mucilaginibacter robiniae]